jgi:catechol 2,3-dioxygenase-like lactoylglutathione lyase family enzyme
VSPASGGARVGAADHCGLPGRAVARPARFYEEKLGFERVDRWTMSAEYVQKVVGYHPDVTLEIVLLAIPDSEVFLEILEYAGVDRDPIDPDTGSPGTAHFCLFVDGLEELYERLLGEGVQFVSELQTPTTGPNQGGKLVYMIDPDGIRVELVETRVRSDGSPR